MNENMIVFSFSPGGAIAAAVGVIGLFGFIVAQFKANSDLREAVAALKTSVSAMESNIETLFNKLDKLIDRELEKQAGR